LIGYSGPITRLKHPRNSFGSNYFAILKYKFSPRCDKPGPKLVWSCFRPANSPPDSVPQYHSDQPPIESTTLLYYLKHLTEQLLRPILSDAMIFMSWKTPGFLLPSIRNAPFDTHLLSAAWKKGIIFLPIKSHGNRHRSQPTFLPCRQHMELELI